MVFKRRDKRPIWRIVVEALWPRGGWGRAAQYVKHRVRRLPGTPERIARGIAAGVFTTFTPFYGFHFIFAGLIAFVLRGNILASFLSTFFGNPLTYVPIGVVSLQTGYWLMGMKPALEADAPLARKFVRAFWDLTHNLLAPFTGHEPHWSDLKVFYDTVFLPYLVGGIGPGLVAGVIAYFLSVPLLRAYQDRRLKRSQRKAKSVADSAPEPK